MENEMCISKEQYNELMTTTSRIDTMMSEYIVPTLEGLDEAIRGNGKKGLETRIAVIEALSGVDVSHVKELSEAKRQIIAQSVATVKSQSVDWKWVGSLLLQALLLGYLVVRV